MSFESPDNEKDFPGLYNAPDQISVTEEDVDKGSKKREGKKEKKEGKDKKKDKGYVVFEEEDSEDEILPTDDLSIIKSPSKGKKIKPTFRFPKKDIFPKSKEKEEKKDREQRKSEDKKKEDKEGKKEKHKLKEKKKPKHRDVTAHSAHSAISAGVPDKPVFGVPLSLSVDRSKCHDGIELPAVFRECIDYIEEHGLACEGIYRISGVKSKVQQLKDCYNKGLPAYLCEHEPNVVASLLKQFLRELPEPVLTTAKMAKFEEASTLKTEAKRLEAMRKLIQDLPVCNRLLLSWMIVHMGHIIEHRTKNKMSLQNVSIVLSPTMQISHRVLNVFFSLAKKLFSDTQIKKYVPPLRPATSRWSLELPDNLIALEEELCKQESLLNTLHEELKTVEDQSKEEQLWEVQRVVTQLKRKIKFAHKASERKKELDSKKPKMVSELDELNLDLQPVSEAVEGGGSESGDHKVSTESLEAKRKSQELKRESQEVEKSKVAETAEIKDENKVEIKDENKVEIKDENEDDDKVENKAENKVENKDENKDENKVVKDKVDSVEERAAEGQEAAPSIQTENVVVTEEKAADSETAPVEPQPSDNTAQETETENVEENVTTDVVENVEENSEEQEKPTSSIKPEEKASRDVEQVEDQQPVKPTGPIQPHLQLSNQPLEPIRICPQNSDSVDSDKMADTVEYKTAPTAPEGDQPPPDEEMTQLLEDEYALTLEEEELLAIGDELKQKIETEQSEIERLKQEIVELQYLRQDSDLEDYSSSSESEDDSDDEEELTELLNSLIAENEELEKKNSELCQKIHDERIACLDCKVSIRLIQQKQADSDNILDRDNPI